MKTNLIEELKKYPIIAAVKNEQELENALRTKCRMVFILFGDICSISGISERIKSTGKIAVVHIDLITGLSSSDVAVQFIAENTKIDGIISTKSSLIKRAYELGLITVQRVFMIDSIALKNVMQHIKHDYADFIEILPGALPKVIRSILSNVNINIISGGLVNDFEDVNAILKAGAIAVSTSNKRLWPS